MGKSFKDVRNTPTGFGSKSLKKKEKRAERRAGNKTRRARRGL